jgi:hypothetical protein
MSDCSRFAHRENDVKLESRLRRMWHILKEIKSSGVISCHTVNKFSNLCVLLTGTRDRFNNCTNY